MITGNRIAFSPCDSNLVPATSWLLKMIFCIRAEPLSHLGKDRIRWPLRFLPAWFNSLNSLPSPGAVGYLSSRLLKCYYKTAFYICVYAAIEKITYSTFVALFDVFLGFFNLICFRDFFHDIAYGSNLFLMNYIVFWMMDI